MRRYCLRAAVHGSRGRVLSVEAFTRPMGRLLWLARPSSCEPNYGQVKARKHEQHKRKMQRAETPLNSLTEADVLALGGRSHH
jgi:hypothetical protein